MSDEYEIKVNMPMFELGELETFDNNIHSIVEEYSKLMVKEKEQILTQRIIIKQEEEIERLNKILEDIDKYIHNWNIEEIGEKTMLILNDILLIKNGMGNEVVRLGSDKE